MNNLLDSIKFFIFDVDGTLILGKEPLQYIKDILILLTKKEKDFIIISNNSSYSTKQNLQRLIEILDVKLSEKNIYTSTLATIAYLKEKRLMNCYILGTPAMIAEFAENGIRHVEELPQAVLLGFDKTLTYEKIEKASLFLQQNPRIPFIVTHPDDTCPMDYGKIPDVGSFLKMFEQATDRKADFIAGKPNKIILFQSIKERNISPSEVLVIGDRLQTDILMANSSGTKSALVLTGETKEKDIENLNLSIDYIWKDLKPLKEYLEKL